MLQAARGDVSNASGNSVVCPIGREVSRVLADALDGGHRGPDLDALLHAVTGHGGAAPSLADMVANHAEPVTLAWNVGGIEAVGMTHHDLQMLVTHMDAPPAA